MKDRYRTLLLRALAESGDIGLSLAAADEAAQFPDETEIEHPDDDPEDDWREEAEPPGTADGKPVDVALSFDIFNKRAQGVLNRALKAVNRLSSTARKQLREILEVSSPALMAQWLVTFLNAYRVQLASLLSATQLAALLEGAREVAQHVGVIPPRGMDVPPPPTLPPDKATALVEKLRALPQLEKAVAVYRLPVDQQAYVWQALTVPPGPPVPPAPLPMPPEGAPERIHFPVIEAAVRELGQKNVVDKRTFQRLNAAARAKAFTVAGVDAQETLAKVRDTLAENIEKGVDLATFRQAILDRVDSGTFLSDAHLETVFRTNVQGAFSDGQSEVLRNPFIRSGFPYVAYEAIHDDRVRPEHRSLENHGIEGSSVYRADDPVFNTFRPPWDYSCRCSWIPLTIRQAAERGVEEAIRWLESGIEPSPPAFVTPPPFSPPAGFQRAGLSLQLSALPLESFPAPQEEKEEEFHDIHGRGVSVFTTPGDFSKEGQAGGPKAKGKKNGARSRGKAQGRGRGRRRLFKELRLKRKKEVKLSAEAYGTEPPGPGWVSAGDGRWVREDQVDG